MQSSLRHIMQLPFGERTRCYTFSALLLAAVIAAFWTCLPDPLFDTPYATVLEDRQGELLGARIADDGQWRFPTGPGEVPRKFQRAIVEYEDHRFYYHPGIDPLSVGRAAILNLEAGRIVSGASTLTMQVIRLSRKDRPRTFMEKMIEMILALRLELAYSKEEILFLYAAHAPFGGNVVGLEAAAWRYFGRAPGQLSWAESATLAVLPNSPALIHPGRNRDRLKVKRDALLDRLEQEGIIDAMTGRLAKAESLPGEPLPLPRIAPHLLDQVYTGPQKGTTVHSTLARNLQQQATRVVNHHNSLQQQNGIHNAAALVADVNTGEVLAYVGNVENHTGEHGSRVDVVKAPRSTGSILKPFLYTFMLNEGKLLPDMLVADIPTRISDYAPSNFSRSYDGAVPAGEALSRSLNVPAVRLLQDFGVPKFHHYLVEMGMTTLSYPPEHYGLSLVLGGAEGTLWDITGMYVSMARFLNQYNAAKPETGWMTPTPLRFEGEPHRQAGRAAIRMNPATVWFTLEAMLNVSRPGGEINWRAFTSSRKVAWKTGTSFGYRDGWAVGVTPEYVIGVWVGNADGEGRPGLIGVKTAGPILFDLFNLMDDTGWFREPIYGTEKVAVCSRSGYRAGMYCPAAETDTVLIPVPGLETRACPFHRPVHLDNSGRYRVSGKCTSVAGITQRNWFVLPPAQEWYYRKNHPSYRSLPPFREGCSDDTPVASMQLIYPQHSPGIYVPVELNGSTGRAVFEVAHHRPDGTVYWHLDDRYLGATSGSHQMALSPEPGMHTLTLVDEDGETLKHRFEVLAR